MQSIRRRLLHASALALIAATLACGADRPAGPAEAATDQGLPTTPPSTGNTRSDIAGLKVTPGALALRVGDRGAVMAALVDANGTVVEVPTGALPWSSSNTAVATVNGAGVVTAIGAGEATVSTTAGGFSGSARVAVTR